MSLLKSVFVGTLRPGEGVLTCLCLTATLFSLPMGQEEALGEARFSKYEIRVIRPRFFSKVHRIEAGAGLMTLTNQSFVYSVLGYGSLNWHFSEAFGLELQGSYGQSFDKNDKSVLANTFAINTVLLRTESLANARLMFTPAYGKMNLPDGEMLYFDSYLALGAGQTGIRYRYDHCDRPEDYPEDVRQRIPERPTARVKQYPTALLSLGQRFFLSADSSLKIGVDFQRFIYNPADGACNQQSPVNAAAHDNVFLFTGWSKFF